MRNKALFAAGLAVGYVVGTRAGRERYDQMVRVTRQAAGSPPVQKATATVTSKTQDLAKTAAAKAPDVAKSAVPKIVDTAKSAAGRLPFTGKRGSDAPFSQANGSGGHVPNQPDPARFNGMRGD